MDHYDDDDDDDDEEEEEKEEDEDEDEDEDRNRGVRRRGEVRRSRGGEDEEKEDKNLCLFSLRLWRGRSKHSSVKPPCSKRTQVRKCDLLAQNAPTCSTGRAS